MIRKLTIIIASLLSLLACGKVNKEENNNIMINSEITKPEDVSKTDTSNLEIITFGAGCFWCVEAVFQQIKGVELVKSGYMGGKIKNPTYREVCSGLTGHAEVCQLTYDPAKVTFEELLEVFWQTHDPTTLNRQGNDEGTQYRSAIFYHTDKQKVIAENYKKKLTEAQVWSRPIVTEISKAEVFYVAEDYHQNYFNQNSNQSYCSYVIKPKIDKVKKVFADKLKTK